MLQIVLADGCVEKSGGTWTAWVSRNHKRIAPALSAAAGRLRKMTRPAPSNRRTCLNRAEPAPAPVSRRLRSSRLRRGNAVDLARPLGSLRAV